MRQLYLTNIERIMEEALIRENISFVRQFPIRCKYGYILDFAIPEPKICIECDGEAWHLEDNSKDRKRDAFLMKKGWHILRFRGKEIENNIENCINTIKILIERRNRKK